MDILGSLLRGKASSGQSGGSILTDILKRAGAPASGSRPAPAPSSRSQSPALQPRPPQASTVQGPRSIGEAARSLEELLNVSQQQHRERHQVPQPTAQQTPQPAPQQTPPRQPFPTSPSAVEASVMNEQAEILVRAMIHAAKADGQIDQQEQDSILKRLTNVGPREIDFLRAEFAKPVDVRELAWSVPLGMEEQVYTISLLAIQLDQQSEATYLGDLAHGLRLSPQRCNELHRKYGSPEIF